MSLRRTRVIILFLVCVNFFMLALEQRPEGELRYYLLKGLHYAYVDRAAADTIGHSAHIIWGGK